MFLATVTVCVLFAVGEPIDCKKFDDTFGPYKIVANCEIRNERVVKEIHAWLVKEYDPVSIEATSECKPD